MYQVGELVLYGSTGVCRVKEIKEQASPATGEQQAYYILQPLYEDCVISAPVEAGKVFMRPIISREEAEEIIDRIPETEGEIYCGKATRELAQHYEALLKSHDCRSLVELTKSIYAKKQELLSRNRKFGTVDERFLKRAEDLLFGELAAALDLPRDRMQAYIASRVEGKE